MVDISELLKSAELSSFGILVDTKEAGRLRISLPNPQYSSEINPTNSHGTYRLDIELDKYSVTSQKPIMYIHPLPRNAKRIILGGIMEISEEESKRRWDEFLQDYFNGSGF